MVKTILQGGPVQWGWINPIKLDFTVPAAYLSTVTPGIAIVATTTALPGREFRGEIHSVSTQVDRVTRSITARALIENADHALKPGLLMTVQLLKNPRRAVVVPEEALVPLGTSNFVFVIEDNTASRREVKIGARRPGDVEILEGLREGELVVTHGTMRLRDGQKVNIIEERKQGQAIGGLMDEAATVQ